MRHMETQKCYLLDLPGELRNRIYNFAREENGIGYISRRLEKCQDNKLIEFGVRVSQSEYLGLTRVCRQIRVEYSPVYADATRVHVCHVDLQEYMNSGFPHLARDKDANIVGNLCIECKDRPFDDDEDHDIDYTAIDIRPFLQCCKNWPSLKVQCRIHGCNCLECDYDRAGIETYVNILLKLNSNSKLQAWINDTVSAIWLRFESGSRFQAELRLDVKQGKYEEWMRDMGEALHDPVYVKWAQETGFNVANFTGQGILDFHAT